MGRLVPLIGDGVTAADYLADGRWHHLAFVKSAATGEASIWTTVSGRRPATARRIPLSLAQVPQRGALSIDRVGQSWNCSWTRWPSTSALPDAVVYAHYEDAMLHHRPYRMGASGPPGAGSEPSAACRRVEDDGEDCDLTRSPRALTDAEGQRNAGCYRLGAVAAAALPRPRYDAKAAAGTGSLRT